MLGIEGANISQNDHPRGNILVFILVHIVSLFSREIAVKCCCSLRR